MKLQPTLTSERIWTIDLLRGLAVFAILFVNVLYMSTTSLFFERNGIFPTEGSVVDQWVRQAVKLFFAGKSYPILSFLFGVGFFLLMNRVEEKGAPVYRFFIKRMLILYLIGVVHMVFFYAGDVLRSYALLGCLLLLFYRRKEKTVLKWAIGILAVFLLMFSLAFLQPATDVEKKISSGYPVAEQDAADAIKAYQSGSYGEWLSFHLKEEVLPALMTEQITYPSTFGMMLLGFYAGRIQLFRRMAEFTPRIRVIRNISGVIGLLVSILLVMAKWDVIEVGVYKGTLAQFLIYGLGIIISMFYISSILLALQKPLVKKLLHPFEYVGKMTLTNYLLQSVMSTVVFVGFGLYAKLNLFLIVVYCFVIIWAEIGLSKWWMSRFRFGPIEWVWRRLTYGKMETPLKVPSVGKSENNL